MREIAYVGPAFSVVKEYARSRAGKFQYDMILHPNSAVIIPLLDKNTIVMEMEYRIPIKKYVYELPAGKMNRGERPEEGAMRELLEETGYKAGSLKLLFKAYTAPGLETEVLYFYIATNLSKGARKLDPDEMIDVKKVKIRDAIKMVKNNKIEDTKTVAGLLFYKTFAH
jgi:ADP-ribose pyrophosphatase